MRIFYARVSTEDQNLARQIQMAKEQKAEKIFKEKLTGKNTDRVEFKKMMDFAREGDIIIVESISRAARNTRQLLDVVDKLQAKGVEFISLKESIDTTTPQGRFVLTIFAALAELEREQTLQRQKEGIAIAKAQGKYQGRQPILIDETKFKKSYKDWKNKQITARIFMNRLGIKPNTFYRRIKQYEEGGVING